MSAELDAVWRALNPWGRFQIFQLCLLWIDYFPACFAILSAVFTGYIPEYTCTDEPGNGSNSTTGNDIIETFEHEKGEQCKYNVYTTVNNVSTLVEERSCSRFNYSSDLSYGYEWSLVCSRTHIAALAQSLVLAGQGLGALIMCHAADRWGRKTIHVISHLGVLVTMAVMASSPNIYMLLALRLVVGTFQQGIVCTGKVLLLEMYPRESRSHMEVLTFLAWSVGMMALALYGFLFQDVYWRYLQLALAAFSVYALAEWWLLDESIRWLMSNGKIKQCRRILRKASRWNRVDNDKIDNLFTESIHHETNGAYTKPVNGNSNVINGVSSEIPECKVLNDKTGSDVTNETDANTSEDDVTESSEAVEKYTVIDILKNPALRVNTLILWYAWIVATGTYYGMTLVSSHLAGDRFVNFFLSGLIEVPALLFEFYLFNKIGRKKTLILFYSLAGLSLIVATTLLTASNDSRLHTAATVMSLIGKSASTGMFSTVFLYTPEIYPTNYRNSGLGIASSISRIGGILSPFVSNLALIGLWIPGAIFSAMCLLVVILATRLPESGQHQLPATIAECDTWQKHDVYENGLEGNNENGEHVELSSKI